MTLPEFVKFGDAARLIPVVADTSREVRAASMLLAVLHAVPAFRATMLGSLGQRSGVRATFDCYTEVVLQNDLTSKKCRPDGLMVFDSGRGRSWSCLIETKIGNTQLIEDQVQRYISLAKSNGIDAVLTISNQFVAVPTHSPLRIAKSGLKGVVLYHWSWMFVLTQAQLILNERDFENAAQEYILSEFARHLEHPSVGVSQFDRMNPEWKELVAKVQTGGILSKNDPAVELSIAAWHQETRDLCLSLSRRLRALVQITLPRSHRDDQDLRLREDCERLVRDHKLCCTLTVPDAASPINITADLLRRSLQISMSLDAPKDKVRSAARINWLVRQLAKSNVEGIQIKAFWPGRTPATQAPLATLRENPEALDPQNRSLAPVAFEVILVKDLAGKFGGAKTFIEHVESAVPEFYKDVGEHLRAYVPPPPKIASTELRQDETASAPVTTSIQQPESSAEPVVERVFNPTEEC